MLRISVSFAGNANPCASLRARAHVNESNYIAEMKGLCQSQYLAFSVYFFSLSLLSLYTLVEVFHCVHSFGYH